MSAAQVTGGVNRDQRFWTEDIPDKCTPDTVWVKPPHQTIKANVKRIRERQSYRSDRDLLHMCLYGSDPVLGYGVRSYALTDPHAGEPLAVNVIKSVISTLVSRVVKMKPKPTYVTQGGDYQLQKQAKQLEKYSEGQFYENKIYRLNRDIVRDACVFGTGGVHGFESGGRSKAERTFMPEYLVDDGEAKYGDPRTHYHPMTIDKMVAQQLWPDFADLIEKAAPAKDDDWQAFDSATDQIEIYRAWHLPSGPKADDGAFAVCTENATLEYDDYKDAQVPYRFLRYEKPILGWYGTGLAQLLTGKQLEINKLLTEIQRSFHIGSNFRVLVQRGSKIIKSHFNNEIGGILEYTGAAPVFAVAQTVHPEKFQHLVWLITQSFAEAGINESSAAGQKDSTLKSGKAQLVALDVEDSRYAEFVQSYEEFCMDESELLLEVASEIRSHDVMYVGKKQIETIDLSEIKLKKYQYARQVFPTSALATSPDRRMEQVQNLANAGWISPADAKRLLDFPDLETASELDTAPYDITMEMLDNMLEEGKYVAPIPQMDLNLTLGLTVNYYLRARVKWPDSPPRNMNLLLQFMAETSALLNPPASPTDPTAQMPVEGGPPPGPPGAPPMPGGPMPPMPPGMPPGPPMGPPPGVVPS